MFANCSAQSCMTALVSMLEYDEKVVAAADNLQGRHRYSDDSDCANITHQSGGLSSGSKDIRRRIRVGKLLCNALAVD